MSSSIRKSLCLVASLALAALVLAACGGDSGRSEQETSTGNGQAQAPQPPVKTPAAVPVTTQVKDPQRRAYIARTDQICRRFDRERGDARERAEGSADVQKAANAYEDTVTIGEKQLREIRSVPVPPGDGQLLRANVFVPLERQLALRRQMQRALAAGDVAEARPLRAQFDQLTLSMAGFARGYGYRACGED